MKFTIRGGTIAVSLGLLLTVASQVFYVFVVSESPNADVMRPVVWTLEMVDFTLVTVAALALLARDRTMPLIWSAIALSGIMNIVQVGMGLSMFGPAREAVEATPELFQSILAGAFFLYFHGKALLGLAAIGVGLALLAQPGALGKGLGGLAILSGIAAAVLNLLGMAAGMDWTFIAGASGTAATAFLALALLAVPRETSSHG